ncbi:MAG: hypothetical protein M3O50_10480 [Myxococcota bacterium]|nr:hypothetical protein [Myxococcota bacterium]
MRRIGCLARAAGTAMPIATVVALSAVWSTACGAAMQSSHARKGTLVCSVSPGDDPCDVCEAQKCCAEQTECAADSACEAADDELDACEARSSKAGQPVARCYAAFRAAGQIAAARALCLEASCKEQCL